MRVEKRVARNDVAPDAMLGESPVRQAVPAWVSSHAERAESRRNGALAKAARRQAEKGRHRVKKRRGAQSSSLDDERLAPENSFPSLGRGRAGFIVSESF